MSHGSGYEELVYCIAMDQDLDGEHLSVILGWQYRTGVGDGYLKGRKSRQASRSLDSVLDDEGYHMIDIMITLVRYHV